MLKNDTLKNGTSRIGLYGSAPPGCHVTSPIWSRFDWLAGLKIRIVGLRFAELEMDKTVHLKLYLPLSRRNKYQLRENISIY